MAGPSVSHLWLGARGSVGLMASNPQPPAQGILHVLCLCGMLWLCGVMVTGCELQATEAELQKPALIINRLKLSPGELQQEQALVAATSRQLRPGPAGEEPEWLGRLIERELLVQEAQQLGLDRQPDFMRTIERFWKEALIKQLLNRKAREIAAQVHVYEPDIEAFYERLSKEVQARILRFSDESSASRVAQADDLENSLAAAGPARVDDTGWQWYTTGELDPTLEVVLTSLEPSTRSHPFTHQGRWIVVAVAQSRVRDIEPLSVLREDIQRTIRQQKQADAMDQWIAELKGRARIAIDREAIATLQ